MTDNRADRESETDMEPTSTRPWRIDSTVLGLDHVFRVLDHPRRRYLLYALATNNELTLHELATKLTAWELNINETTVDDDQRDRMYTSLYHAHVPKLVDHNVVYFDSETETITPSENTTQVFAVLEGAGASLDNRQELHAQRPPDTEEGCP